MSTSHQSLTKVLHESLLTAPQKGVLQGHRRLTKGRSGKRVVFFPSKKNDALMPCESRLEADNCLDLEFDQSVTSYRTQPFTIDLGSNQSYTPDSIHQDRLGTITVREVKFSGALTCNKLLERLERIRRIFAFKGYKFEILTEKTLQVPPKHFNYKFLYRCSHQTYDSLLINHARELLNTYSSPCSLHEFRNLCSDNNLPSLIADTLLFIDIASYDSTKELSPSSLIWLVGGDL